MSKDAGGNGSVGVATLEDRDDATIASSTLVLCNSNGVAGEAGEKVGGYMDFVSLHASTLVLACIKSC